MLAALLTACGDKAADSSSGSTANTAEPAALKIALRATSEAQSSNSSSCQFSFSITNPGKEKLTLMAEFDPVDASSGALISGGFTRGEAVFSAVAPGATASSVTPGYASVPCGQLKLQLVSFHCLSTDCEPELHAEGIAGIEDRRGQPRAQPAAAPTSSPAAAAAATETEARPDATTSSDTDREEAETSSTSAELTALASQLGIQPDHEKLAAAQQALAEAEARDDPLAIAKAQLDSFKATVGNLAPLQLKQLRETLPTEIAGLPRGSVKSSAQTILGMKISEVEAQYGDGRLSVKISDNGAAALAMQAMAAAFDTEIDNEDDESIERSYRNGDVRVQENYRKDGSHAQLVLILTNGVQLQASGSVAMDALKRDLLPVAAQLATLTRGE
jgi:hypothetical protein